MRVSGTVSREGCQVTLCTNARLFGTHVVRHFYKSDVSVLEVL